MKDTNPKDAIGATKVPLSLLSPIAKAAWALAQFAGSLKYGRWNWRAAGVRSSIYTDAVARHLDAYLSGEELDPVDGTHHLANIMACCAILLDAKAAGKLTDDRPPSVDVRPAYAICESQMATLRGQYADKAPKHYTIDDVDQPIPYLPTPREPEPFQVPREPRPVFVGDELRVRLTGDLPRVVKGVTTRMVHFVDGGGVLRPDADDSVTPYDFEEMTHADGTPVEFLPEPSETTFCGAV